MKTTVQESEDAIKSFNLLSNLTTRNIINFLRDNGPSSPSEIARKINISPSRVSICLQNLLKYNLVSARWKPVSIDERPLKLYTLVPNVLRFEFVLNEPNNEIKTDHTIEFRGNNLMEFKDNKERGAYVSLGHVPFRFGGHIADVLKECTKGPSFGMLAEKYKGDEDALNKDLKKLLAFGLIEITKPASK